MEKTGKMCYHTKITHIEDLKMTTVGERIKELREKKKLSVERLAKKLKVTPETVTAWESGELQPDNKQAKDLAIFLSSTAGYIQFGVDNAAQVRTMFPNKTEPEKVPLSSILFMVAAMFGFVGAAGIVMLLVLTATSMDAIGISNYWLYFEDRGFVPTVIVFGSSVAIGLIISVIAFIRRKKDKKEKSNNHGYYF